ncbi:MAG: DUF4239 domain-containing protein [Mycobacterium sp.]|nr:DUF4239 domain-containing protein [Mycobacterium sp.]
MSAWVVSHIPPLALLVGLIVLIAGGAVALQVLLRRRFALLHGDEHNDVTKFTYGVIGFVYAFFFGFMASAMWGQINAADAQARIEGAVGVQLALDAGVFGETDADRIRSSLLAFEEAAIAEWPDAAAGRSAAADAALADVYRAYEQIQPDTEVQKAFLSTSLSNLDKASQGRTERISEARLETGPSWPLWVVFYLTSAMVLGSVIIYGVRKPVMHSAMVATVGTLLAVNLFLVVELSQPFRGDLGTSPEPLHEVVAVISELTGR